MMKGAPDYLAHVGMKYQSKEGVLPLDQGVYDNVAKQLGIWADKCYRNIALC